KTFAAADVQPMPLYIEEQVVGVPTRLNTCNRATVRDRDYSDPRRIPESDENPACLLVKDHRKIAATVCWPARDLLPSRTIDYRKLLRFRYMEEDAAGRTCKLKPLGMRLEQDLPDLRLACGVDQRQPAVSVSDPQSISFQIQPHVIGVVSQV